MKKLINKLFLKLGYVPQTDIRFEFPTDKYQKLNADQFEVCLLSTSRYVRFPISNLLDAKEYLKQQERQLRRDLHNEIDKFIEKRTINHSAYSDPTMEVRVFIATPKQK